MEARKNSQNIDVKYLVNVILKHWYLLVIATVIFVAVAIVYLSLSSKTYLVGARIVINVDDRAQQRSGNSEYFDVAELMQGNRSFQNELTFFQSTPLVREVVDDMNLLTSYYMQEGRVPIPKELLFTLTNIYRQSPFIVIINEDHVQPINTLIGISIIDDATFSIGAYNEHTPVFDFQDERLVRNGVHFSLNKIARFGETIETENCSFKVLLNSNYNPETYQGKQLFFQFNDPNMLAHQFRSALNLQVNQRESTIVNISFQWGNSNLAAEFLTNLIDKYAEKNLENKNRLAVKTLEYIDQQLSTISTSLGRSEQQLQNFRSSYDVMSIDQKTANLNSQMSELERAREEAEYEYNTLVQLRDYFEQNKDNDRFIPPSLAGLEDEVLSSLIQDLAQLSTERQDLINRNQIRSPRLRTINQSIDNMKQVITENISFRITAVENQLSEIDTRIQALNQEFAKLPQAQRRLVGIEREFNITDAAYTALLNKRIEAQITRASNESDCEVIEPVRYQGVTAPSPPMSIALAIALGLLFPLLYVLAKLMFSDKISNLDEIKSLNDLKEIGMVPRSDGNKKNVILNNPHSPISEAFHTLKSNLVYYLFGERNKVILITSAVPNEGKSFNALNLAASFASTHNKTLLVSLDLRKGTKVFNGLRKDDTPGISSYLINRASLEEIVLPTEMENLHFIDSGEMPPDPVGLISLPKTKELFEQLKKRYDYIIIDSPPYDVFTDAFLLMGLADIKLFVTRLGVITRKALRNCLYDFRRKEIEDIYLVINDLKDVKSSKYAYYRQHKKRRFSLRWLFRRK